MVCACGDAAPPGGGQPGESPPGPPEDSAPPPPTYLLSDTFVRLPEAVPPYEPVRERGVGIAFPAETGGELRHDTIHVHAAPQADAPVVARLIRDPSGVYALEARTPAARGEALEHGYEEIGLPVTSPPGTWRAEPWLRVHYARTANGAPLEGWIRNDSARVAAVTWSEWLRERPLFFVVDDSIAFHAAPDGEEVRIELARGDPQEPFDYILWPLETSGRWMRVEVATPSTYCFDPPAPRTDTVWIRYLDDRDRPRVWYYTRGC